ncbi:uncharacterized protein C8A04DRAFT_24956 [Dichotomopilus funicola]|uniref:magnesium chelatase n=1 Tax=Dichotomopilus funicola TaxID=1934379 RepID=A0AAN6V9D5_9PEZI|nr:hypothetical protein C8A04DRAFT_24956 [Dichotomopilus funicola]
MASEQLLDKIHTLSDLELAALLCLIAREHCLISTEPDSIDELAEELRLVAARTFNLTSTIVSCRAHTTLDEFANGLFVQPNPQPPPSPGNARSVSPYHSRHEQQSQLSPVGAAGHHGSYFPVTPSPRLGGTRSPVLPSVGRSHSQIPQARIANVILAKDLDRAPRAVQIQALELLRTRRIFTRTSVQTAPKQFLFIALVGASSGGQARVTPHLNDFFYISHWHDPDDHGFPYLDEELDRQNGREDDDDDNTDAVSTTSSNSVIRISRHPSPSPALGLSSPRSVTSSSTHNQNHHHPNNKPDQTSPPTTPLLTEPELAHLSHLAHTTIHTTISITRYQSNFISFLRSHRAVALPGSVSPAASRHLADLSRSLACLHGLDYVTPSIVGLAARKVYAHRLELVRDPIRERSVQWGSEVGAVAALLGGDGEVGEGGMIGPEEVLEEVLGMVKVPL